MAKKKKRKGKKIMFQVGDEVRIIGKRYSDHPWKLGRTGKVGLVYSNLNGGQSVPGMNANFWSAVTNGDFAIILIENSKVKEWIVNFRDLELVKETVKREPLINSLILPKTHMDAIYEALSQTKNEIKTTIFSEWGLGRVLEKGMGISMLFYGRPGTGKTYCAEAIAEFIGKTLITVGAAEVESSEPGGCERAIKTFFSEAKKRSAVLLFDECDSLIYDRGRVGMILGSQINCLLSELERFDGVTIFTTNNVPVLDHAMERRLTLKLEFPEPDQDTCLKLWKRMFPVPEAIGEDVDFNYFLQFKVTGGHIKNIVLNAARRAAHLKHPKIMMEDLKIAFEREAKGHSAFNRSGRHIYSEQSVGCEMGADAVKDKRKDKESGN